MEEKLDVSGVAWLFLNQEKWKGHASCSRPLWLADVHKYHNASRV